MNSEAESGVAASSSKAVRTTDYQRYCQKESEKLERWADDLKSGLEREIKELDRKLREANKLAKGALTLEAKLDADKQIKLIDLERTNKRKRFYESQDEIDEKRDGLIGEIEERLKQQTTIDQLFALRWALDR